MQPQNDRPDMRGSFNFAYLIINGHALTMTTFLRTDFGKEALGFCGIAGFAIILLYGGMVGCPAMVLFLGAWMISLLCQRVKQFLNWRNGIILHSRYNGYPWLSQKLFKFKTEANARGCDAFICLAVGGLIAQINPAVGMYIMAGFGSILISEALIVEKQKKRMQDMADAEIEQQSLAEEMRRYRR